MVRHGGLRDRELVDDAAACHFVRCPGHFHENLESSRVGERLGDAVKPVRVHDITLIQLASAAEKQRETDPEAQRCDFKLSSDSTVVLGAIEIVIFLALSAWLVLTGDLLPIGAVFSSKGSLEAGIGGWQGILHGMIFAFLAFAGFESSAPLAEEAREPRRTVPLAIVLATLSIGLFYVFCSYAAVTGWGMGRISAFAAEPNPWGTMARQAWGRGSVLIIFAILNSGLGNAVAGINAASRAMFAMSRAGTLPRPLAHINRRFRTPDVAILANVLTGVLLTIWLGTRYGPATAFALVGTSVTILILVVYVATCLSVPLFYFREHRAEFRITRHVLIPLIPTIALVFPISAQFVPAPPAPINLAGPVCGIWLVLGVAIVTVLRVRAPETLSASGRLMSD
jgi:amino acid transporter